MLKYIFTVFLIAYVSSAERDFYKILEIKRSAKERDIKKAFKKMSIKYHPDKNPSSKEEALKKYQDVSAAYEVLGDPEKRRKYDRCGEKCVDEPERGGGGGFADIFSMFGGGFGQQQEQTGPSMVVKIKVPLADLYVGKEMEVKYTRQIICPHCRGSGADDPSHVKTCTKCKGQGATIEVRSLGPGFQQQVQVQCNKCNGEGKIKTSTCHLCKGANTKQAMDDLFLFIEKGTPDGYEEKFRDAGDEYVNIRAGDVTFKIVQIEHPMFQRKGDNLHMWVEISLREALLGFEHTFKHLDGHEVKVSKDGSKVTQPGETQRIKGEGMPKYGTPSDFGDLIVTYKVKNPEKLDDGQVAMLKTFFGR